MDTANDYAKYLKLDISKELQPIHNTIDEMLTRLEEFESVMKMVEGDNQEFSSNTFSTILECKGEIEELSRKVDKLQLFVNKVDKDLTLVEKQVETAEAHIGVPDNKLKTLFKPLFGKMSKEASSNVTETKASQTDMSYQAPNTFKTSDYFL